jgi:putative phage-type endonuclease
MIEYGKFDVEQDRHKFIGGSDIPIIMGLSSFKTRWQLLLEKAQLAEDNFSGNRFTNYGNIMEPKIREYINLTKSANFQPTRVIDGDLRLHTDGFDGDCVLEIKTTSDIHATATAYRHYLVQLVKYMEKHNVEKGILAVYNRPEDFDTAFDPERLQVFDILLDEHRPLLAMINKEIDRFRADLETLKENPLLTEQDFLPMGSLITLSQKVVALENQLAVIKEIEQKCKEAKQALLNEMLKSNVKTWVTPNGTRITRVDGTPGGTKTVSEFDTAAFKADNPAMYSKYLRTVEKATSGKSGYVKITLPKG